MSHKMSPAQVGARFERSCSEGSQGIRRENARLAERKRFPEVIGEIPQEFYENELAGGQGFELGASLFSNVVMARDFWF